MTAPMLINGRSRPTDSCYQDQTHGPRTTTATRARTKAQAKPMLRRHLRRLENRQSYLDERTP